MDRSIPIAFANETMHSVSGGIGCVVHTLNELVARGYDARCYVLSADTAHDWLDCRFPILPWSEAAAFDGVMVSTYSPVCRAVSECAKARLRMFWVHSYEPYFPFVTPKPAGWAEMAQEALRLPLIKFAASSWVRSVIRYAYHEPCLTTLVPGGVDTSVFRAARKENDPPVVAFLSRPEPFRGTADIVAALRLLRESTSIKYQAWAMGIPIVGAEHVPHMAQPEYARRLATADVFVHASHFEGLPLPPLEAMAAGCAVVATYPGAIDYLLHGTNALVVPPGRPDVMAAAIGRLLMPEHAAERRSIAVCGMALAHMQYSWSAVTDRLLAAVEEGMEAGHAVHGLAG